MPNRNIITGQSVSVEKVQRAKELRVHMTAAESRLWQALRADRLDGWHFRRQQVIAGFIVDFYCHQADLVVEVDGPVHEQQREQDAIRDGILARHGLQVLRFSNDQVFSCLPAVLQAILEAAALAIPAAAAYQSDGMEQVWSDE